MQLAAALDHRRNTFGMNVICHDFVVMLNDFSYFRAHSEVFDSGSLITMIAEIFQPLQERGLSLLGRITYNER